MEPSRLPSELQDLVDRVAAHPHGLGFLHSAYLDGVAVTLGVHPFIVEAARELLETPSGRATMIEEVRRARERLRRENLVPAGDHGPADNAGEPRSAGSNPSVLLAESAGRIQPADGEAPTRPAESVASARLDAPAPRPIAGQPDPPKEAEDLIAKARSSPLGIRFLLQAPPESVAVSFGVHPFVVFRARGVIRSRKIRSPDASPGEEG